jgi:hypothetical protein
MKKMKIGTKKRQQRQATIRQYRHLCIRVMLHGAPESSKDIGRKPICLNRLEPLFAFFITFPCDFTIYLFTHGSDPKSHWLAAANEYFGPLSEERRGFLSINVDPVPWHQIRSQRFTHWTCLAPLESCGA